MIVAHGNWIPSSGRFLLWGESNVVESKPRCSIKGEPSGHPFQCSRREIEREIFRPLGEDGRGADVTGMGAVLLLPTVSGRPLPSPELVTEEAPSPDSSPRLMPWGISGMGLSPLTSLAWLSCLPSQLESRGAPARLGADIRFWATASRLALEMLARQRFLPDLEARPKAPRGCSTARRRRRS